MVSGKHDVSGFVIRMVLPVRMEPCEFGEHRRKNESGRAHAGILHRPVVPQWLSRIKSAQTAKTAITPQMIVNWSNPLTDWKTAR